MQKSEKTREEAANSTKKVLDCTAMDNKYLHKDFHGAMCFSIKYLDENFGREATAEYLRQVGKTVYSPLINKLGSDGLSALEDHWRKIFTEEGGEFHLGYEGNVLVLRVDKCPAVAHLKRIGKFYTDRFCEITVLVNETICNEAGFACSCEYVPSEGKCVQKFWKKGDS